MRLWAPLALGAAAWSVPAAAPLTPPLCRMLHIPRRVAAPADREVALTFDDGPHAHGTPAVLDALERAGVRATFFLVGEQAERRPALVREILEAGHAIGLHGHRHRNLLRVSPGGVARDLERGAAAIAQATGRPPVLYRPPYGIFSAGALIMARRLGHAPILWSRWGRDWSSAATPESIASTVTRDVSAGDVLLLHDADFYSASGSWRRTAAAIPRVLEEIDRRGLAPVVLGPA
jgi:peptidoglycan-N-acetylglucosamine deacetylase